jgi:hypothetical protein
VDDLSGRTNLLTAGLRWVLSWSRPNFFMSTGAAGLGEAYVRAFVEAGYVFKRTGERR